MPILPKNLSTFLSKLSLLEGLDDFDALEAEACWAGLLDAADDGYAGFPFYVLEGLAVVEAGLACLPMTWLMRFFLYFLTPG